MHFEVPYQSQRDQYEKHTVLSWRPAQKGKEREEPDQIFNLRPNRNTGVKEEPQQPATSSAHH